MISMLKKGKNGNEILTILNAITDNPVESVMETVTAVGDTITAAPQPTLEEIQFWLVCANSFSGTVTYHGAPIGVILSMSNQFLTCLTLFLSPLRARKLGIGLLI